MSVKVTVNCDECGAERKAANHWFVALLTQKRWVFYQYDEIGSDSVFPRFDVCGQDCATKAFQRLLTTGSVQKVSKEAA
jgi:hypothetical protein